MTYGLNSLKGGCMYGDYVGTPPIRDTRSLDESSYELWSKLLVSPLVTPIVVPSIIPNINPL